MANSGKRARSAKNSTQNLITGIGDDCAVLRITSGRELLVTTDFSLEGIHFRRDWHPAESVGHRCLARGLSDIAAMGGDPAAAFLSLALPRDVPQAWVRSFIRGWMTLAKKYDVPLAGGDTARSPNKILADIIVIGSAPKGKAVLRSTARAGDRIFVSGELGGSAAAVAELMAKPTKKLNPRDYPRHFYPEPRLELGRILRENLVSAMIDLSDGLSTDLAHICEESGVGAKIASALIPRARVGKPARQVALDLALHGGEDYELLFTVPQGKHVPARIAGVALTEIGAITRSQKILLQDENGVTRRLPAKGWEHFR
jgi:thiamine-monophosphate kinase